MNFEHSRSSMPGWGVGVWPQLQGVLIWDRRLYRGETGPCLSSEASDLRPCPAGLLCDLQRSLRFSVLREQVGGLNPMEPRVTMGMAQCSFHRSGSRDLEGRRNFLASSKQDMQGHLPSAPAMTSAHPDGRDSGAFTLGLFHLF